MNFINQLSVHKIVEPNKLTGLRTGHMEAQALYVQVGEEKFLDNGHVLFLSKKGDLVLGNHAEALLKQPFLHYTEELMDGPVLGTKYFTVEMDQVAGAKLACYPRAIALYEGDEFTTSNFKTALTLAFDTLYYAIIAADGMIEVVAAFPAAPYKGPVFTAKKDVLAAGDVAVALKLVDKFVEVA